jgi:hypothetical protein
MCGTGFAGDTAARFRVINPHCLESILRLSETMPVMAACDIFDEFGTLLLAKGEPISRAHRATFLQRRLRQPLEDCLRVEGGETLENIVADCLILMQKTPALAALGGANESLVALRGMGHMPLHGALQLLLTLLRGQGRSHCDRRLAAMIVSAGLAHSAGLDDDDTDLLLLAALVRDIGELYIDPQYLDDGRALSPDEWMQVASHPGIGRAFIREFTRFPSAVAESVAQHHERMNGSGYPFQLTGSTMSALGKLIGVADTVSALIMCGGSGLCERIELALTMVPEEFPAPAVSFVNTALARLDNEVAPAVHGRFAERILPTLQQLRTARCIAEALAGSETTGVVARASRFALDAIHIIDKRLRGIGVYDLSQVDVLEREPEVMGEACLLLSEVAWRLRQLARIICLRVGQSRSAGDLAQVAKLVAALSEPSFDR